MDIPAPADRPKRPTFSRADARAYGLSVLFVALAVAATRLTWPVFERTPVALVIGAVLFAGRFGSESAALVAMLLGAVCLPLAIPGFGQAPSDARMLALYIGISVIGNRFVGERNRAVAALAKSEAQFRATWEHAALGAALLNRRGQVERINPALERLLGYPGTAWVGVSFGYFSHPDDAAAERERFANLMASGEDYYQREQRYRRQDGGVMWGHVTVSALRTGDAEPAGALMVIEDVTARRLTEDALRASEAQFRGLFEGVPVGLFRITASGQIAAANRALLGMLGYASVEALGAVHVSTLYADAVQQLALLKALDTQSEIRNVETTLQRADGTPVIGMVSVRAVRSARGAIVAYEGSVVDLTDQRGLEDRLVQAQKLEALGLLVGGVVHDFRNVLTAMGGYTELALQQLGPDAPRKDLEESLKVGQRAATLAHQLLAFSGPQTIEPQAVSLNNAVAEAGSMFRRVIGADIEIVTELAPDLCPVLADPGQVEQLLVNLAMNARDAMPGGGRLTFATANVVQDVKTGPRVRLTVSDTGLGMDERVKTRLFEPFFTTKPRGEGTGLGLMTVNTIVKRWGGSIEVQSEPGRGTTFRLYFPAAGQLQRQ